MLVGTHALFQEDVQFAIWRSRSSMSSTASACISGWRWRTRVKRSICWCMTATPIPRTLVLTYFGDMDVSRAAREAGRAAADRHAHHAARAVGEVVEAVGRAHRRRRARLLGLPAGRGIGRSRPRRRRGPLRAVQQSFGETVEAGAWPDEGRREGRRDGALRRRRAAAAGGHHGDRSRRRRAGSDHHGDRACRAVRPGAAASVARAGRPRRGQSTCLLLYQAPLGETAKARLAILRETEDGFRIAEEDLRLRGGGEVLGTRQSGMPEFRLAGSPCTGDLLDGARRRS